MEFRTIINNYLMYMWNHWDFQNCIEIFGKNLGQHIWEKWLNICTGCGPAGAPAVLWSQLDGECQQKLAVKANEYYKTPSKDFI